jgi:polyisoprenoid-binding protein YceI
MVRVPSDSFDSGNVNRDAHAKEAVEAARYPFVVLKATGALAPPAKFPTSEQRTFNAVLSFHGVDEPLSLPVTLRWESPGRVQATARFAISLDHFKVERPSLLFVKVEDQVWIDVDAVFTR